MQDSEVHKERENARREALRDRLAHVQDRPPQTASPPPAAELRTEARLRSIFRAAPVGIGLVANRVLLEVNDRLCEMVGYCQEELVGQSARMLYLSDEDYEWVGTEKYRQIQEHGTGTVETRWRCKDGTVINVLLSSTPLDLSDLSQGVTFTALDITTRKKTEDELQSIFDLSLDLVCIADISTSTFVKVNPAFERTLGYSPDELVGRSFLEHIHPDDAARTRTVVQEKLRTGEAVINFENRYRCRDGTYRWLSWTSHPKPEMGLTYAVARDITERKRVEETVRESEAILNETGRIAGIGGWKHDLLTGKATWTKALYDIIEIESGPPPGPEEHLNYYPPAERRILEEAYDRAVKEGKPFDLELQVATAKGRPLWCRVIGRPVMRDGQCVEMRGTFQEITERKRAEDTLRQSEERYRTLVEGAPMSVLVLRDGKYAYANSYGAAQFGCACPEELVGHDVLELIDPAHHAQLRERIARTARGEPNKAIEVRLIGLDGLARWIESASLPITLEGQSATLVVGYDITERKRAEDALRDSEQRYRAIVEDQTEFICRFTPDGHVTFANEALCRFYGQSRNALIGKDFAAWMTAEQHNDLWERLEALTPEHPVETHENEGILPNGRWFWGRWSNRAIFDETGSVIEYQAVGRDVTSRKETEESLHLERDRAQTYLDTAGVIFVALDTDGRVNLINRKGCEVLEYAEEEIVGQDWFGTFLPPGIREKVRTFFAQLMRGEPQPIEYVENLILTKSGKQRLIAWHNTVLRDETGRIISTLSSGEDITERKRAEAERTRLTTILEATSDLVSMSTCNGQISYVNKAGREMLGWADGEAPLSGRIQDFHPEWAFRLIKDKGIPEAIENGVWSGETAVLGPEGQEISVSQVIMSHKSKEGTLEYFSTIMRDLTERKATEVALRESEARFRELAEMLPQTVFEMDAVGKFTFTNHAGLESFGYTREELADLDVLDLFAPQDRDRIAQNIRKRLSDNPVANREYLALRRDGSTFPILLYASPILRDGATVGLRGIGLDITEHKQAEAERQARLHALESMERINRVIREATDPEQMLRDVMEAVHSIFDSDRAWLLYPCDPDAPSFRVPVECARPEYPGANALDLEVPMHPGQAQDMREALASEAPSVYAVGTGRPVAEETAAQFGVQSQMFTAVYPKLGQPWLFGLHQCSHRRLWTNEERSLFQEIGHRLADGLSSLLSLRDLKESETRFRDLAELLPQTVFEIDGEGRLVFVSRLGFESFGYSWQELRELRAPDLFVPEDRERMRQNIARKLSGKPFWDHEYTAQKKDGTMFPALVYSTPILRDDVAVGLRGILVDITERQYAERALQESKAKLESILESSPNAISVTDLAGNIADCNQAMLDMHGYATKDELLGRSVFDQIAEGDRARANENMNRTLDQGLMKDVEYTLLKKDGREFPCEVSVSLMKAPTGQPIGLVAAMADITERKRAQEALRESEEKYRSLIANIPDVVWTCDERGNITFMSPNIEHVSGYGPQDFYDQPGQPWFDRIHHEDQERVRHAEERLFREGTPLDVEYRFNKKDDQWIWLQDRSTGTYEKDGVRYADGVFIDITERKKAETALRESLQTSSDIVASIPSGMFTYKYERPDTLRLIDGNPAAAQLTGLDIPRHIGRTFDEIWPRAREAGLTDKYLSVIQTGQTFETEEFIYEDEKLAGIFSMRVFQVPGSRLCVAFENVTERRRAEQKLRAYQKKLKALASELSLAEERERRRMAAGLHDHACQNLVLSKMKLQGLRGSLPAGQAQALEAVCQTLNTTIESIRELTFDLSSPILYKFGLVAALEELLKDKLRDEHAIHYQFLDDGQPKPLSQDVLVLLFQSVRELLINAIKHARTREVILDIRRENDSIRLVLTDDGVGFDVSEVLSFPSQKRSVGLFHILERLDYIGGKLDVESEPGRGSRFTLIAPLTTEVPVAKEPHDGTENSAR